MSHLYAITGITGHVGGVAADVLLGAGHRVRGLVRDAESEAAKALKAKGVELAVASFSDTAALTKAFEGVDGVFVMSPPLMTSPDPRKESLEFAESVKAALIAAKISRIVLLSSIAAHLADDAITGPIIKCYDLEQLFFPLVDQGITVHSLRAGYFAENTLHAIAYSQVSSTFNSLVKLDTPLTIVSTKDIGTQAAKLLTDKTTGLRIVELEGPKRLNYKDISSTYFKLSGKTLPLVEVPVEAREGAVKAAGFAPIMVGWYISLLKCLDNGTLTFEGTHEHVKGTHSYEEFLTEALAKPQKH